MGSLGYLPFFCLAQEDQEIGGGSKLSFEHPPHFQRRGTFGTEDHVST